MDKKLGGLMALFFLSFFVFISLVVFNKPLSQFTRAAENFKVSAEKTLVVVWPLSAVSNKDKVRVDVFVRSEANTPMSKRDVTLQSSLGVVDPITVKTDDLGQATFYLISQSPGEAGLTITIDGTIRPTQQFSVHFD